MRSSTGHGLGTQGTGGGGGGGGAGEEAYFRSDRHTSFIRPRNIQITYQLLCILRKSHACGSKTLISHV